MHTHTPKLTTELAEGDYRTVHYPASAQRRLNAPTLFLLAVLVLPGPDVAPPSTPETGPISVPGLPGPNLPNHSLMWHPSWIVD